MLSKIARHRLGVLIRFMEKLPRSAAKHFDMSYWIDHRNDDHHDFGPTIRPRDPLTCGTTACAMGFAAMVPSFRRAGLVVQFKRVDGWCDSNGNTQVGKVFFDLDGDHFDELFGGDLNHLTTPKQWAKHARQFLRDNAS